MQSFTDLLAQHTAYSYRASSAVSNEVIASFDKMSRKLRRQLIAQLSEMSQRDLRDFVTGAYRLERSKALRDLIQSEIAGFSAGFAQTMDSTGVALAEYEAAWMVKAVTSAAAGYEAVALSGSKIYAQAMKQPIVGYLFDETMQDVSDTVKRRVFAHLRTTMADGQTNQQIIADLPGLFGTETMKYKDGGLNQTRISLERIVRTTRTHIGNQAYQDAYDKLGVRRVMFRATLDGRVSEQCASLDSSVYEIDKPHPQPPLHPNCLTGDASIATCDGVSRVYRRAYKGVMVNIRTKAGRTLKITPNHPVLTARGWIAAKEVNSTDKLVAIASPSVIDHHQKDNVIASFADIFSAANVSVESSSIANTPTATEDFHGDVTDAEVSVVSVDGLAWDRVKAAIDKGV